MFGTLPGYRHGPVTWQHVHLLLRTTCRAECSGRDTIYSSFFKFSVLRYACWPLGYLNGKVQRLTYGVIPLARIYINVSYYMKSYSSLYRKVHLLLINHFCKFNHTNSKAGSSLFGNSFGGIEHCKF